MRTDQHLVLLLAGVFTAIAALIVVAAVIVARRRSARPRPSKAPPPAPGPVPVGELGSVDRLARLLDRSRRLIAAEERVERELDMVRGTGWMIERNVVTGVHRVPFVVLGPGGLFTVCATDGAWTMHDLEALTAAGDELRAAVPDYHGPIAAVVCLAFDDSEPRSWHTPTVAVGWVVGIRQLLAWLDACTCDSGISSADIANLHAAAGPDWRRQSVLRLPLVRNIG